MTKIQLAHNWVVKGGLLMKEEPGEAARGAITESLEVPGGGTRLDFVGNGEQAGEFVFVGGGRQNNCSQRCPHPNP